ncbi:MAG: OmpA family protein [Cellvibrionaceae bacterium]
MSLFLSYSVSVNASAFESDPTESEWLVNNSVFECRLSHDIPYFGDAVFFQKAGESQAFFVSGYTPRFKSGKAALRSEAPVWKKNGVDKDLGFISVRESKRPIRLDNQMSERILAELRNGMDVFVERRPWYGSEESLRAGIRAVNFRAAYDNYLRCIAGLLPVNFEQIERSAIYFGSGKEALLPSEVRKLDNIGTYYKADRSVKTFYVDGHSDGAGSRSDNLVLSQERAEMVVKFLVARGIPEESIITRWHGERYPVASNQSRKGRSQNRRVTIRLSREAAERPAEKLMTGDDQVASR